MSADGFIEESYPEDDAASLMAAVLAKPADELDAAVDAAVRAYTPSCITLDEVDRLETLAPERLAHVDNCNFCSNLRETIRRRPLGAAAAFADLAANDHCSQCGSVRGRVSQYVHENPGKVAVAAASVAALAVGGLVVHRLTQD